MKLVTRLLSSLLLAGLLIGPASAQLIGVGTLPKNLLDNPRFDIYQRTVTAATISSSATAKYHADRWAVFTGGSSQVLTATNITASLPTGFLNAEQIKRTSGSNTQTINIVQEISQADMAALQGQAVSLSCWLQAGSGLAVGAATANTVSVGITTGTTADEGIATFISGWTGAATPLATTQLITTNWARYGFGPVTVASGANEIAVSIGYTPTGSQQTNEFVNITGCQLEQAPQVTAFENRPIQWETARVQRYAYAIAEKNTLGAIQAGVGTALGTTTTCSVNITFPTTMRIAPTYTNALSATTFTLTSASQAATALSTPFSATLGANSPNNASINFTTTGMTAKDTCELTSTAAGAGLMLWTADF